MWTHVNYGPTIVSGQKPAEQTEPEYVPLIGVNLRIRKGREPPGRGRLPGLPSQLGLGTEEGAGSEPAGKSMSG
jgi:hypothetical protein